MDNFSDTKLKKTLNCKSPIVVRELAALINIKPFKLISILMDMGIFVSMNNIIEESLAIEIAKKYGYNLNIYHRRNNNIKESSKINLNKDILVKQETETIRTRPPIICILGHVDHGKTTLLEKIKDINLTKYEFGGITQHISTYSISYNSKILTFIDTPGHEAFSKMRERGINITDIAILVVSADDGFMPQTIESINFIKKNNVPVIVAINKIDLSKTNIDKIKQQMQKYDITSEDWGGTTQCVEISAIKNINITKLLDLVLLETEMLELKANYKNNAKGVIIEAKKEVGYGISALSIIKTGILKIGDFIVSKNIWCKVKALINSQGKSIDFIEPSIPVNIIGWSTYPNPGSEFIVVKNIKSAKKITNLSNEEDTISEEKKFYKNNINLILEKNKIKTLKLFIKCDTNGTLEVLKACINSLANSKVNIKIIKLEVSNLNNIDVIRSYNEKAAIVGFNVKIEKGVYDLAKEKNVKIFIGNVIYHLLNDIKNYMLDLLDPEIVEKIIGKAEIRKVFKLSKKSIAGIFVTEGLIKRSSLIKIFRGKTQNLIYSGKIDMLKRFKENVNEVKESYECGIEILSFNNFKEQDQIICFEKIKIKPTKF